MAQAATADELIEFFEHRFRDSNERSRTWLGLRRIMDELLGRPAVRVRRAAPTCTSMFLQRAISACLRFASSLDEIDSESAAAPAATLKPKGGSSRAQGTP
jgi:hypothetical protein